MDTDKFINTLFHDKPERDFILIWEKKKDEKKTSHWFDRTTDAVEHFHKNGKNQDTYIGCGTSPERLGPRQRCLSENISGIPGIWLDIDIFNQAAHTKTNLPHTKDEALKIIEKFPIEPTMIVWSGHGYQIWWVFKDYCKFLSTNMREEAADLVHRFYWYIRDYARGLKYDIDMTFDLARVFRIPGGFNYKDDPPAPVILENFSGRYTTPVEFRDGIEAFRLKLGPLETPIGERRKQIAEPGSGEGCSFRLNPDARPPADKFDLLAQLEPKFLASWRNNRADFRNGDNSPSTYDFSLASFALGAGWTIQETVDLLVAYRRENNLPQKLVYSYYQRTVAKVMVTIEKQRVFDDLKTMNDDGLLAKIDEEKATPEQVATRNEAADNARKKLSMVLSVNLRRVVQFGKHNPEYRLEIDDGRWVHLGPIQNLIEHKFFRRKFAEATRVYLPNMKDERWHPVAQAMLNLCEEVEIGDDTSNNGLIEYWLRSYLEQKAPLYDINDAIVNRRAFYRSNYLYIIGQEFRIFVRIFCREDVTHKGMGIMLREYGFKPVVIHFKQDDGKDSTRSMWRIHIEKDKVAQEFVDLDLLAITGKTESNLAESDDFSQAANQ